MKTLLLILLSFFSCLTFAQNREMLSFGYSYGLPTKEVPQIKSVGSIGTDDKGIQTWNEQGYVISLSADWIKKFDSGVRIGLEYQNLKSTHAIPIMNINSNNEGLGFHSFQLDRNVWKVNLSRPFYFFDEKWCIEPKLKIGHVQERYSSYSASSFGEVFQDRHELELDYQLFLNSTEDAVYYKQNLSMSPRDITRLRFEWELAGSYQFYKGLSVSLFARRSSNRYMVYKYQYTLRTTNEDGSAVASTMLYGQNPNRVAQKYSFLSLGLALNYTFGEDKEKKRSKE